MIFKEKIQQDLKAALKDKNELEILTLRQLLAAFLNKEKEKQYKLNKQNATGDFALTEEEMIDAVSAEAKKRREAIDGFVKGGRQEQADKERKELVILQKYLPEQLSEEEIKNLVKIAVAKTGSKEIKDMGKVMAELSLKIKGKAEGSLVSKIVKELLVG